MYPVSNAYKTAMKNNVQRFRVFGTVKGVGFTTENILAGSLSISNQCSGNENIEIGQVYIGELNCTFLDMPIARYDWYGAEIVLYFGQEVEAGIFEDIPVGIYTISEAEYTESGVVVKAYDNVAKLDKSCNSLNSGAFPYTLAKRACDNCKLKLETTEGDFATFANGRVTLGIYPENDISTYRDLISWIAQTCACFVTASRTGGILFKAYNSKSVDTIDEYNRFSGCSFSDFVTRYSGLSVVNMEKQTTSYYAITPDNALTYNLGSNPFLQIPISHAISTMRQNVLNEIAKIEYVPFKAVCIGNPAYDLGDVLTFTGGIADGEKKSCITKIDWIYGQTFTMQGVGKNPALANGHSKSDKNIAGLISQTVSSETIRYTVLRNGTAINISDGQAARSVMFARYLVTSPCHVRFNFEILLTVTPTESSSGQYAGVRATYIDGGETIEDTSDYSTWSNSQNRLTVNLQPITSVAGFVQVKATYKADGIEISDRYPIETWAAGKHILTLQYDLDHDDSVSHTFDLWLECSGGSISIAENDGYEVISSTALAADNTWQGTYRGDDDNLYIVEEGTSVAIPDRIRIGQYPSKMTYTADEIIDYTGCVVLAVYGDGHETDITAQCSFNPANGTPFDTNGDSYVEVDYSTHGFDYSTGFNLTYNYILNMTVTPPTKINYNYGQRIDYSGLSVSATYRDGTQIDVTNLCTIEPPENTRFDYYKLSQ